MRRRLIPLCAYWPHAPPNPSRTRPPRRFSPLRLVGECRKHHSRGHVTTAPGAATTSAAPTTSTLALDETVLAYQTVADLDFPVQLTARPGEPQAYVITKNGLVWLYDGASVLDQPVLDISDRVLDDGEQGLLSIALHPVDSRRIFLHYSDQSGATTVSEFALPALGQGDSASERVLLQVVQPAANHNGGMLQFSPDGALLLGLGDGGGAGDRFGNGQNPDTLLGAW